MSFDHAAIMADDTLGTDEVPLSPPPGTETDGNTLTLAPEVALMPPPGTEKVDLSGFRLNTPPETVLANVATNLRRHLPQLDTYQVQATHLAIVGGGWSLEETLPELNELIWGGAAVMALNGAGLWLLDRNIRAQMLMVLDARPMNVAFVERPIPGCKYLLASQCDPAVFDACAGREVLIYHVHSAEGDREIIEKHYAGRWREVLGGSTVGLRALHAARMLGFRFLHLFGMDSCTAPDGRHHAYAQPWQDAERSVDMWCAGRKFRCSAWQASQAENFLAFIKNNGEHFHLQIHGDGLLAHMVRTGAKLQSTR